MSPACLVAVVLVAGPTRYAGPVGADKLIDYEAAVNARLSAGVTPDTNALVPLWKVFGPTPGGNKPLPAAYFKRLGAPCPPPDGDYFRSFDTFIKDRVGDDEEARAAMWREEAAAFKRPWKPADHPAVAEWLAATAGPLDAARAAVARPAYYNPMVAPPEADGSPGMLLGSPLSHAQACRGLSHALTARAMLRTGSGDRAGAWADILAGFRLARHVGSGGTMIEDSVGVSGHQVTADAALVFVAEAKLSPAEFAACRRDLDALPALVHPARGVDVAHRAQLHDVLNHARRGMRALSSNDFKAAPAAWKELDWRPAEARADEFIDRAVAVMRMPDRAARRAAGERYDRDVRALKPSKVDQAWLVAQAAAGKPGPAVVRVAGDALLNSMLLQFEKCQASHDRAVQARQNVRVAFALTAYKLDRGVYPPDLRALVPFYLPAGPDSVFTQRPPEYAVTPGGYELRTPPPGETPKPGPHAGVSVQDGE